MNSDLHPHENHGPSLSDEERLRQENRLTIAIVINLVIVGTQIIFGIVATSLGLLADAGHNFVDVGGLILSLYALRMLRKRATDTHSFGYHRTGVLAAQANAALILLATGVITVEAIRRLNSPHKVEGLLVVIVALIGAAANIGSAYALGHSAHDHKHDLNMKAATLHLMTDGIASLGVAAAGLIIVITGKQYWLDPAVSLAIGALIAIQAWRLLRDANDVLLESTPRDINIETLTSSLCASKGVDTVHDLHVWSLSSDLRALSAHIVLEQNCSIEESQKIIQNIKEMLKEKYLITHVTLECETEN